MLINQSVLYVLKVEAKVCMGAKWPVRLVLMPVFVV